MNPQNDPRPSSVRLIGLGIYKGTRVADLREGDTLLWNWGVTSEVVKIERSDTAHSVVLRTRSREGIDLRPQRKALATLVVLYACGGGCVAGAEDPSRCRRCNRKLVSAARPLPVVTIEGKQYHQDDRLREYRAVDNPHDRLSM